MLFVRVPWLKAILNWVFSCLSRRAPAQRGLMIDYYVPEDFQTPQRLWLPPEDRGKVLKFSARGARKSA